MSNHLGRRHIVIPDVQVKPKSKTAHLEAAGNYIADHRPDTIICIGDFADMPSLSSHKDRGHIEYEGARYSKDIDAALRGMRLLMKPIKAVKGYSPELVMTLGNHEHRIRRTVDQYPMLKGKLSVDDLGYKGWGWKVIPFLRPKEIDGVLYCHYFVTGVYDKPIGRAAGLISKYHQSCFAGHLQGRDIAYSKHADGRPITSIIAGSFYDHDEGYLSHQSNQHWRGIYMLNEVRRGSFDEVAISLNYLKRKWL